MPNDEGLLDQRLLVDRVVAGDRAAARKFVLYYESVAIYMFKIRLGLPEPDVADLLQELWIRLAENNHRRLRRWSGKGQITSYIGTIAHRMGLDFIKARARWVELQGIGQADHPGDERKIPDSLVSLLGPDRAALNAELLEIAHRCLAQLPERYRRLIELRRIDALPAAEVGQRLDMTANNVNVALSRAEVRLMDCLTNQYPGLFANPNPGDSRDFL